MRLLLLAFLAAYLNAEVIDRLVITVDRQAVTELQLDEELRVTAFLNGQPIIRDLPARREAADRLVQQLLIRHEMELSRYPLPDSAEVAKYAHQLRSEQGGSDNFSKKLKEYQLTDAVLQEHLGLQLTTLRFIDYRFSSDLSVSDAEIEFYYRSESQQAGSRTTPAPQATRESIRQKLIEQRTDEALDRWLKEARKRANIIYLDRSLQ